MVAAGTTAGSGVADGPSQRAQAPGPAGRAPRRGGRRGAAYPCREPDRLRADRHTCFLVLSRGDVGVPIFFTLSGLLLYRKWAAAALTGTGRPDSRLPAPPRPAHPARVLGVVLIALPVLNAAPAQRAWPWLQYLLLLQNYDVHPWWTGTGATGLAQMWSLVVEVSFYLVLPLLAAALTCSLAVAADATTVRPVSAAGPGDCWPASPCWRPPPSAGRSLAYYPHPNLWFNGTRPPLMIWFCTGMAIAVVLAWAAAEAGPGGAGWPGRPLGGGLGGNVRADRRLRLRHRVHPAHRTRVHRCSRALGDRVQDRPLRPHRGRHCRAGRLSAAAGGPGGRDALRPVAGQPPGPLPGQDLLRHLPVAVSSPPTRSSVSCT